ncbi:S-4TM family putative pore-forming effector [Chryseobacterium salviniae]|uniref:S-4TM family putative pore-forming effector n=1 Tax=Chryseobacterium salviniae TaxID=3101750 RepID=A0ABU6HRZ7_9FLAO|nr:S-4TM family putative pore-forming effector [Chryseobacterium sp. T9W2-O]MEC3874657.1 S-4TM family putative pore-forming effector [Chryseobacterium sp. T9W2-O]
MNNIKVNQEKPENLKLLKSQRVIYYQAKNIYKWQLSLTIIVVIFLNFIKIFQKDLFNEDITAYITIVSVTITLLDLLFFSSLLSKMKTNAAKIQELFDCSIYGLDWNITNSGEKPDNWSIEEALNKYVENPKAPVTNWYHIDLNGLSQKEAILRCQLTNLEYDRKLRFLFKNDCIILASIIVVLSFIIATFMDASLKGYLTHFISPSLPLIVILIKIIIDNQKAVKALEEVRNVANKISSDKSKLTMQNLRQLQDKLFFSRKDSVLIPENYYLLRRSNLEKSTASNFSTK